jgi:ABC-type nickel/cobalt efflux system permease component RcnA
VSIRTLFLDLLRIFDGNLNSLLWELTENFSVPLLFSLVTISFAYGFIHSAGPGHGKTLISSIFLKEKHPLSKSLLVSSIVASVHIGSAVLISVLFTFILTGIRGLFHIKLQGYFTLSSGILICLIGIVFLILKILHKDHYHHHKDHHDEDHHHSRNIYIIGLTAGMVPCPAALMIMLLTIPQQAAVIGLISVAAISLGMFSLLTIVGIAAISARDGILRLSRGGKRKGAAVAKVLEYTAVSFIILIGSTIVLRFVIT